MSDEKALLQHLACVVPESSWFFRGHLQHVAEYLSRAGLALVPAADVPTPEERAERENRDRINLRWLQSYVRILDERQADPEVYWWVMAELARRAAKSRRDQVEQVRTVVEEAERIAKEAKG